MSLNDSLTEYQAGVSFAMAQIIRAHQRDSSSNFMLSTPERNFIIESAFLKIFIEWEKFLESSFTKYLTGELSIQGRAPVRFATPQDIIHARKIIIGTMKYFDWSNPEYIIIVSENYFANGEPFKAVINSINTYLFDLKTIRNAAAHLSSTTTTKLDALSYRLLSRSVSNINVGTLLLDLMPNSRPPETVLNFYLSQLDAATIQIANF